MNAEQARHILGLCKDPLADLPVTQAEAIGYLDALEGEEVKALISEIKKGISYVEIAQQGNLFPEPIHVPLTNALSVFNVALAAYYKAVGK